MDTNIAVPIIIALVMMIPGIWALVNQINKDKQQGEVQKNMVYTLYDHMKDTTIKMANLRDDVNYTKHTINERISANIKYGDVVDKIWEQMYARPVIVRCNHCSSPNIITNLTCTQCGAPLK